MDLVSVTQELQEASVEELAQTLRLVAGRAMALQNTNSSDSHVSSRLMRAMTLADAIADDLYALSNIMAIDNR